MFLLLNLAFALLFGWIALRLAEKAGALQPLAAIIAVIVGIIVYMMNLAARVV